MSLPKRLYIARRGEGEDAYFVAETKSELAIEDDGPTVVGVYKLVEVMTLRKVVEVTKR